MFKQVSSHLCGFFPAAPPPAWSLAVARLFCEEPVRPAASVCQQQLLLLLAVLWGLLHRREMMLVTLRQQQALLQLELSKLQRPGPWLLHMQYMLMAHSTAAVA
ncbi:hypothetical protein AB1Y20_012252 [Prymnesium parvum]|uniref:Secreted protein n=1 Tax=Prymnesium parvum TaxID=97485 RepID=A0AB34IQQ4_PRYPA